MASANDFKILNLKCLKYFEILEKTLPIKATIKNDIQKMRIGFYLFILESFGNGKDIRDLIDCINDTDFNDLVFGHGDDDFGVDAVIIDDEKKEIKLFNFKYREKFNINSSQGANEAIISSKFTNAILNEDVSLLRGKTKSSANSVIKCLRSNDVWRMTLHLVSNENNELSINNAHIELLKQTYDLEVIAIALPYISNMLSIRPSPIDATLLLDSGALMSYVEHDLSSSKSYIARLRSSEVVRITCNDKQTRDNYSIEDLSILSGKELDYGVLFDNVRGFVLRSKYNENIEKTLKENPTKLFMYNNGITIVAKGIDTEGVNGNKKQKVTLKDFQILNGGQTLRTIHNFNSSDSKHITDYLCNSEILVRMFVSKANDDAINKIAEYTNSQNSISPSDLKSLSSEQIDIEKYLEENDIIYSRKSGDIGNDKKTYTYKITMEKFGQILLAVKKGEPDKSSNHKQHIFGKYYDELFIKNFDISDSVRIVKNYYEVINTYSSLSEIEYMEQKAYYILYMKEKYPETPLTEHIKTLEDTINTYKNSSDASLSDARKMIQVKFKDNIDSILNDKYGSCANS